MPETIKNKRIKARKASVAAYKNDADLAVTPENLRPSTFSEEGFGGLIGRTRKHSQTNIRPLRVSYLKPVLTTTQFAADIFTVFAAFWFGYLVWNFVGPRYFSDAFLFVPFSQYHFSLGVALVVCLIGFEVNGLYHPTRSILNIREFEVILKTCLIGCGVTLTMLFLAHQSFYSRTVFALTWSSMIVFMFLQRYLFFRLQNSLRTIGLAEETALVYGAGVVGRKLIDKLRQSPKLGYHVVGFIDDSPNLRKEVVSNIPVIGGFHDLRQAIINSGAQTLFIALPNVPQKVISEILDVCKSAHCKFQIVPSLYEIVIQRVKLSELDGIPLIGVSEPKYSIRTVIVKRIFDFISGILLSLALSPVLFILALLIKLTSKGPILFKQERVGKYGRKFMFYKFRSMYVDAPVYAETPHSHHDRRITPIGRFLRRSSLDELPQLINVLKGDMSLVGPRPEMPFIVDRYNEVHRQRLNVRPGITGLWQISADRKLAIHENMDYDIYYINNQSFLLDIVILLRTVTSCLKGIGAY